MLTKPIIQAMVGTTNADKSRAFYVDTLGLKLVSEDLYGLQFAGAIGFLRVAKVPAVIPSAYTAMGFVVEDIAKAVAALGAKGVKFETFAWLPADPSGVWSAPDGTKVAWFRDPDMNLLSLTQNA